MFDIFGPFVSLIGGALVVLFGVFAFIFNGKRKKAEGRKEGRAEEQERSRKKVEQVETEMEAEVKKPRTTTDTKDRLNRGDF